MRNSIPRIAKVCVILAVVATADYCSAGLIDVSYDAVVIDDYGGVNAVRTIGPLDMQTFRLGLDLAGDHSTAHLLFKVDPVGAGAVFTFIHNESQDGTFGARGAAALILFFTLTTPMPFEFINNSIGHGKITIFASLTSLGQSITGGDLPANQVCVQRIDVRTVQ